MLNPSRIATSIAFAFALCASIPLAHAQVYKCKDPQGKTIYAGTPCDSVSKPLRLPDSDTRSTTDPRMCAQLHDELNRLANEAERKAPRGRPESMSSAKRRQSLTRQYEARCVGISRSEARPK